MNAKIFEPGKDSPKYQKLMKQARQTNIKRDADEHKAGFAAPADCTLDNFLRTAISAIACGIGTSDWNAVAEGLDMLQQAELTLRVALASAEANSQN